MSRSSSESIAGNVASASWEMADGEATNRMCSNLSDVNDGKLDRRTQSAERSWNVNVLRVSSVMVVLGEKREDWELMMKAWPCTKLRELTCPAPFTRFTAR